MAKRKVLLIGWDAADWKIMQPLLDAGKMPALARLVDSGVSGRLATLRPILSPMLWTTIATGVRPFKHGVHGFTEPDPDTGRVRPISSASRKVKAIWNILNQNDLRSCVVGWWPSHPVEPINGVMISNHYQRAMAPAGKPWPMQPGTVHPERLVDPLRRLRMHPAELTADHLLPFVPKAAEIDQETDKRLEAVARTLADCTTIQAATTAVMQNEPWDFMGVYFDAIDHFGHGFMKYHPPRQPHIPEKDFDLYQGVMEAAYRYHDMMLGVLLQLAGPETTVILMSDHGFHSDHLRPAHIPFEPAGPAIEHSPYGILVVRGPGIKQGEHVFGASLLDITPTILQLFDLPVGKDMQGKPLLEIFDSTPEVQTIDSWEKVEGDSGMLPPDYRTDPDEARQSLQQLVDLGYIEDPGENAELAVKRTVRELQFNLAQAYLDDDRFSEGKTILEELWHDWPDELRFANLLMLCYRSLDEVENLARIVDELLETRERLAKDAQVKVEEFQTKIQEEQERRKEEAEKSGEDAEEQTENPILTPEEQHEFGRCRVLSNPGPLVEPYLRGLVALAQGDLEGAAKRFMKVATAKPRSVDMHLTIGEIFAELKRWDDARGAFEFVLEIDPEQPRALFGLGRCALAERRDLEAIEFFLETVGMSYHFPRAHHLLGIALHRTNRLAEAIDALLVSLSQNPNNAAAHSRLARIYKNRLGDQPQATHHRQQARSIRVRIRNAPVEKKETLRKDTADIEVENSSEFQWPIETFTTKQSEAVPVNRTVTIVSGLPRSGTSMMMQMLSAGGITPLVDENRPADEDNPRGYYEYEPARQLIKNKQWLPEAKGRVVKLVAQLLPHLPTQHSYRIVFIKREIDEVLRSQRTMLDRLGRRGADLDEQRLAKSFSRQLSQVDAWLNQYKIPRLVIGYRDVLDNAQDAAEQLANFLNHDLNLSAMAGAVDHTLYRQRSSS